jgi:hypothetical protein
MSVCAQTFGTCPEHGMHAGSPCAEDAAELPTTEDVQARLSLHHALWMAQRYDIEQLQAAENRQDSALTELEVAVAEINALYDQVAELRRQVKDLSDQVAQLRPVP